MKRRLLSGAWLCCLFALSAAPLPASAGAMEDALHARMDELQFAGDLEIEGAQIVGREVLPAIYAHRDYRPLWTDAGRVQELRGLLESAPEDGLSTADYLVPELERQAEQAAGGDALAQADLDILLTEAYLRYAYHQLFGKVNPGELDPNINFKREFLGEEGPVTGVIDSVDDPRPLREQLDEYLARGLVYRVLQRHLAEHREMAAAGGWPQVPPGPTLRRGDIDPRITALRRRLAETGDLPPGADMESEAFDEPLEAAVKRFQGRHALSADGIVGGRSYEALNVPVQTRIDQLRLSLERLRWLWGEANRGGERYVVVNIAGFRVFFGERDEVLWEARAMVGRAYRQTPVFAGRIAYMEINPTWTVPPTILREDVLPAIKRDVGYLARKNMSVIDRDGRKVDPATVNWQAYSRGLPYSIRQEPGPGNALGEIKFIWPNRHAVFLHDTAARGLFARPERTFSSGCIRVEHPFELAELLLDDAQKWDPDALQAVRDSRKTRRISVPDRTPVLIVYLTASLETDGRARFLRDVYQRDAALLAALDGPVTIELPEW